MRIIIEPLKDDREHCEKIIEQMRHVEGIGSIEIERGKDDGKI